MTCLNVPYRGRGRVARRTAEQLAGGHEDAEGVARGIGEDVERLALVG